MWGKYLQQLPANVTLSPHFEILKFSELLMHDLKRSFYTSPRKGFAKNETSRLSKPRSN